MARFNVISRPGVDRAKDGGRATSWNAKGRVKTTPEQMQDNVKASLSKIQSLMAVVAGLAGIVFQRNLRKGQKKLKKAQKRVQSVQEPFQDSITAGIEKTRKTMQLSSAAAQKMYAQNVGMSQKKRRKAQKNLSDMQESLQASVVPAVTTGMAAGLAKTQDVLQKGSEKAGQRFQQMTSGARGMKESVQDQYMHYQQKRRRARRFFRWGLVAGIILALLFTPIAGSEVRRRLTEQWQKYRAYVAL